MILGGSLEAGGEKKKRGGLGENFPQNRKGGPPRFGAAETALRGRGRVGAPRGAPVPPSTPEAHGQGERGGRAEEKGEKDFFFFLFKPFCLFLSINLAKIPKIYLSIFGVLGEIKSSKPHLLFSLPFLIFGALLIFLNFSLDPNLGIDF